MDFHVILTKKVTCCIMSLLYAICEIDLKFVNLSKFWKFYPIFG